MPRVSRYFVRAALLHFLAGTSLGAWALIPLGTTGVLSAHRLLHAELLLIGWLLQLALGVASWILPFSRGVSRDRRMWIGWALLNGGLLTGLLGAWAALPALATAGRLGELAGCALTVAVLWPRTGGLDRLRSRRGSS